MTSPAERPAASAPRTPVDWREKQKVGWVTIARTESNVSDPYITITMRGETTEMRVEMSLTDFAMAVTGLGRAPVEVRHEGAIRGG